MKKNLHHLLTALRLARRSFSAGGFFAFCLLSLAQCLVSPVYASYVLPYPSFMPGNKLYRVSRIIDTVENYWHWGTIAQMKYHIGLSDKYLVEAKTLFEYKQYLLATDALKRSDGQLSDILVRIDKGNREGKDMSVQRQILSQAMQVHGATLESMKSQLPGDFLWTPEKTEATQLSIGSMLDASIQLRKKIADEIGNAKLQ